MYLHKFILTHTLHVILYQLQKSCIGTLQIKGHK